MAMLRPPPRGGFTTKQFNWRIHEYIGYKGFKYPCGGYPMGPNTDLEAGQIIPVRFWTTEMADTDHLPKKSIKQARHGGGMCEFSLSYDGGMTFHVIATYTKTCPDAVYEWPVRIPDNVPSCNKPGKCLFAWSWTAALIAQYYHNCADVTITGKEDGMLPKKTIQIYNFKGHQRGVTFPGDGNSHGHGPGPLESEVKEATRPKTVGTNMNAGILSWTAASSNRILMQKTRMAPMTCPTVIRFYTSKADQPAVTVTKSETSPEVAIVTLHQSAFNHDTAKLLVKEWNAMEQDQSIRAAMLKSDLKSIFCAGIDFSEFLKGPESFANYWRTIRQVFDVIYSSRLNTAASMHGHSLGLGCVLGMACQDRFMVGSASGPSSKPATIGLNEVAVGVPVPHWLVELFADITSRRHAERFLPMGRILSVQEAASIGLVDKVDFLNQEQMDEFVVRYLAGRSTSPREAQRETMRVIRLNFLKVFRASEEEDVKTITRYVQEEEAQTILKEQLRRLTEKSKK
ncbi:dodecenoyl-CoA isomerase [Mortierella sp. GBA30]|nr:dodecenoyl-CoA isomerase [Mortierella sp. GBA30]